MDPYFIQSITSQCHRTPETYNLVEPSRSPNLGNDERFVSILKSIDTKRWEKWDSIQVGCTGVSCYDVCVLPSLFVVS